MVPMGVVDTVGQLSKSHPWSSSPSSSSNIKTHKLNCGFLTSLTGRSGHVTHFQTLRCRWNSLAGFPFVLCFYLSFFMSRAWTHWVGAGGSNHPGTMRTKVTGGRKTGESWVCDELHEKERRPGLLLQNSGDKYATPTKVSFSLLSVICSQTVF